MNIRNRILIKRLVLSGVILKNDNATFVLKNGEKSNIYANFRSVMSGPNLLEILSHRLVEIMTEQYHIVSGVPMGAIPFATKISDITKKPMIMVRNERKVHGLRNIIEGNVENIGNKCYIVEDVITTGESVKEIYEKLKVSGFEPVGCVCLLDRRTSKNVIPNDLTVHSVLKIGEVEDYINSPDRSIVRGFIKGRKTLCLSPDSIKNFRDMCAMLSKILGDNTHICAIKIHSDIIEGFDHKIFRDMFPNVLIIEDRKFVDIGDIARKQYLSGHMYEYADAVTVLNTPGASSTISGLIAANKYVEILLVTNLTSSLGAWEDPSDLIKEYPNNIVGVITTHAEKYKGLNLAILTTGIHLHKTNDHLKQNYMTPKEALSRGADCIIVARGIFEAIDPYEEARMYIKEITGATSPKSSL